MGHQREPGDFLVGITEINFALYPSSWGRLQCNAETYDGKKYHSWAGRADQTLTRQMLIDALDFINIQIKEKENDSKTGK